MKKENFETMQDHIDFVESKMGMTWQDYNAKLDALIDNEYMQKAKCYYDYLNKWLSQGKPIVTCTKKNRQTLELKEDEIFFPCFNPDQSGRKELPIFWFMSNHQNLVSVHGTPDKPYGVYWLRGTPHKKDGLRIKQIFINPITGKKKNIEQHVLTWLTFNRNNTLGKADEYIDMFGIYAFWTKENPFAVNVHHIFALAQYPELMCAPENLLGLSVLFHNHLRKVRDTFEKNQNTLSSQDIVRLEKRTLELKQKEDINSPLYVMYGSGYGYFQEVPTNLPTGCYIFGPV